MSMRPVPGPAESGGRKPVRRLELFLRTTQPRCRLRSLPFVSSTHLTRWSMCGPQIRPITPELSLALRAYSERKGRDSVRWRRSS